MTKQKQGIRTKEQINIKTVEIGMWNYIRSNPFLSAMYRDELLARDAGVTTHNRFNRRRKKLRKK